MRTIRIFVSVLAVLTAVITLLSGLTHAFGPRISRAIEHNKELAATFKRTAQYVSLFKVQHGRLPSEQEFDAWTSRFPKIPFKSPYGITLVSSSFPQDAIREFGTPAKDAFLLAYRRGQSTEFYAPWNNRTSLDAFEAKQFILGNKYAHAVIVALVAWMISAIGCCIWPHNKNHRQIRQG